MALSWWMRWGGVGDRTKGINMMGGRGGEGLDRGLWVAEGVGMGEGGKGVKRGIMVREKG